jgi:serine phosphatase RsbU (regulator of sigma subunit)/CHASE2 domain-containing sensor protein
LTPDEAPEAPAPRIRRIRTAGVLIVALLALLIAASPRWAAPLREAWFNAYQRIAPRTVAAMPAVIVDIDGKSLAALGRWPWPRSLVAELVTRVGAHEPAALGVDMLMPEPDPLSPDRLLAQHGAELPKLHTLPGNDALLARALAATPSVLAVAGMPERTASTLRAPPFAVVDGSGRGTARPSIEHFDGALTSVDVLNRAASGWGLVSANPAAGVMGRIPLVADIDGTLIGAMAIEMFRVASRAGSLRLLVDGASVRGVAIGNALVRTEADGGVRVYYSPRNAGRFVSAVDLLEGRVDPERLRRKLVLIAVSGLGLADYHYTPVGERMPGSEIQAQLLENLYEDTLLHRPSWAGWLEAMAFILAGALLVWAIPRWKPRNATLLALGCVALLVLGAYAAFRQQLFLFDAATPSAGLAFVFAALLVMTASETTRHRRALELEAHRHRVRAAHLAGELDAARRIQMATLPRAEPLRDERLDLAATMLTAREVGGDLYDFFRLDHRRLFLLVGDVAGKGLSASIFMAVSKALCKSTALRSATPDMGALLATANEEISRDNPQMLFVSAFAAILDLVSGELAYCNAGHENPCLVHPDDDAVRRVADGDGPPLCAVDGFPYRGARLGLRPDELVCVVSDGVTEAQNPAGELYGNARLEALLLALRGTALSATEVVEAVRADVVRFRGSAEPSDDLTVLALRWRGVPMG